ncbi:hypothetical protein AHAS_Ahas20G0120000 [Arachis hypogaea]
MQLIRNGPTTKFWKDNWVNGEGTLEGHTLTQDIDGNSLVWEWTNEEGNWNLEQLNTMPPAHQNEEDARRGWRYLKDGDFSVGLTYKVINNWTKPKQTIWSRIWKWKGHQKAKVLM